MRLIPPDTVGWKARFDDEAASIRGCVAGTTAIEHIGSTALGIDSKDVVDVLVGISPEAHDAAVAGLRCAGFTHEGDRATVEGERHSWLARSVDGQRVTVVHVVRAAGAEWHRRTTFRDRLRHDEALRVQYVALKRNIAGLTDDWSEYTARKAAFVQEVLASSQ